MWPDTFLAFFRHARFFVQPAETPLVETLINTEVCFSGMLGSYILCQIMYRFNLVRMWQPFPPTRRLSDESLTASTPESRLKIHPSVLCHTLPHFGLHKQSLLTAETPLFIAPHEQPRSSSRVQHARPTLRRECLGLAQECRRPHVEKDAS